MEDKKQKKQKPLRKRVWKRIQQDLGPHIGHYVGAALIRLFGFTMKKEILGLAPLIEALENGVPVILSFWHGRMLMLPVFYERYVPWEFHVLISLHADGELIAKTIGHFGLLTARGSSHRGGQAAALKLVGMMKNGANAVVTPDGPRGPGEVAKRGVIELACAVGAAIFPLSYGASRQKKLKTWDKFVVPAPFSRLVFYLGEPLRTTGDETPEEKERLLLEIQRRMTEASEKAEAEARRG